MGHRVSRCLHGSQVGGVSLQSPQPRNHPDHVAVHLLRVRGSGFRAQTYVSIPSIAPPTLQLSLLSRTHRRGGILKGDRGDGSRGVRPHPCGRMAKRVLVHFLSALSHSLTHSLTHPHPHFFKTHTHTLPHSPGTCSSSFAVVGNFPPSFSITY